MGTTDVHVSSVSEVPGIIDASQLMDDPGSLMFLGYSCSWGF